MWNLSSVTRDGTHTPCLGYGVLPLAHQGSPGQCILSMIYSEGNPLVGRHTDAHHSPLEYSFTHSLVYSFIPQDREF